MAAKLIETETINFQEIEVYVQYLQENGYYFFRISHVIQEPNGNIIKPGGGTSMDTSLDDLKYKVRHCYLTPHNCYDGCKLICNDDF